MDIVHVVEIQTTPEKLYHAITTQDGIAGWWTRDTKASPTVGNVNEHGFPGHAFRMRVEKLDAPRHVAWSTIQAPPDWTGTRVTFDITPGERGVMLRFVHGGFASTDGGYGFYNFAWAGFLRSLKLMLETGRGEPA